MMQEIVVVVVCYKLKIIGFEREFFVYLMCMATNMPEKILNSAKICETFHN